MYSDKYFLNVDLICRNELPEDNDFIYTLDGLDNRYSINKNGLMFDNKFSRIKNPIKHLNTFVYEIVVNGKPVRLTIEKIYLMAFSPMHVDFKTYQHVLKVNVRNHELGYLDPKNINWIIPDDGIECDKYPGFYSVVGMPDLVISKDYVIKNYNDGFVYSVHDTKGVKYPSIGAELSKEKNVFLTRLVHRIVALAFIPFTGGKKDFYVNHIDADKNNYNVSNLEWTNHLDNNLHAIANGLRSDNHRVRITNMLTGEIKLFHSAGQCAKFFNNVTGTVLSSMEQYKRLGYLKFSPWLIQYQNEPLVEPDPSILKNLSPTANLFYLLEKDGKSNYYFGIGNIPVETGITRTLLSNYPRRLEKQSINGYLVSSFSEFEVPEDIRKKAKHSKRGGKAPIAITVTNEKDGSVKVYPSTEAFAKEVNFNKKSIQHVANRNNGKWRHYWIKFHEKTRKPSQDRLKQM